MESRFKAIIEHLKPLNIGNDFKVVVTEYGCRFRQELNGFSHNGDNRLISNNSYTLEGQLVKSAKLELTLNSEQDVIDVIDVLQKLRYTFASDHEWSRKIMNKKNTKQ